MMGEAGYTLVETLTALAILALAIGGLTAGIQVMARQQSRVAAVVADTEAIRSAQASVDRLFERRGPFRSHQPDRLSGGDHQIRFDCGRADPCVVRILETTAGSALQVQDGATRTFPLRAGGPAHFAYQGALGMSAAWPPEREERQALRGVSVVRNADGATLLKTRLWVEQPLDCEFDVVMQDCR